MSNLPEKSIAPPAPYIKKAVNEEKEKEKEKEQPEKDQSVRSTKPPSNFTNVRTKVDPNIILKPEDMEEQKRLVAEDKEFSSKGRLDEDMSIRSSMNENGFQE